MATLLATIFLTKSGIGTAAARAYVASALKNMSAERYPPLIGSICTWQAVSVMAVGYDHPPGKHNELPAKVPSLQEARDRPEHKKALVPCVPDGAGNTQIVPGAAKQVRIPKRADPS
jgi:hypothetical protein